MSYTRSINIHLVMKTTNFLYLQGLTDITYYIYIYIYINSLACTVTFYITSEKSVKKVKPQTAWMFFLSCDIIFDSKQILFYNIKSYLNLYNFLVNWKWQSPHFFCLLEVIRTEDRKPIFMIISYVYIIVQYINVYWYVLAWTELHLFVSSFVTSQLFNGNGI